MRLYRASHLFDPFHGLVSFAIERVCVDNPKNGILTSFAGNFIRAQDVMQIHCISIQLNAKKNSAKQHRQKHRTAEK